MAVGRKRKHNKHLPLGVTLEHGAYYYRGRDRKRVRLGTALGESLAKWAAIIKPAPGSLRTMRDVFKRYRLEVLPKKAATTVRAQGYLFPMLEDVFGEMAPVDIRPMHAYEYLDTRGAQALTSANHEISLLSHCLTKCVQWGVIERNPLLDLSREEYRPKPRDRYVTDAEFSAVYELAPERIRIAMDLALLTGLRRGDILALTRHSVTDDGLLVRPSKSRNSTGKALIIEWSDDLRRVVARAQHLAPRVRAALLCNRSGKAYTGGGFAVNWQKLQLKALEVGAIEHRYTFHDLRAKSASDDSLQAASERLGHSSQAMTKRVYVRTPTKVRPLER